MTLTLYRECDNCGRVDESEELSPSSFDKRQRARSCARPDSAFAGWVDYGALRIGTLSKIWEPRSLCPDCAPIADRERCLAAIALTQGRPVGAGQYGRALVVRSFAALMRTAAGRMAARRRRWRDTSYFDFST